MWKEIKGQLNLNLSSFCDWFIGNTLNIHLGEDKAKSVLFGTKFNIKRAELSNIVYDNVKIKLYTEVTYLGCIFDESLSGESIALHILNKINSRLRFLYRQNGFLNKPLWRRLCNAIIQPFFSTILVLHGNLFYEKIYKKFYRILKMIVQGFVCNWRKRNV